MYRSGANVAVVRFISSTTYAYMSAISIFAAIYYMWAMSFTVLLFCHFTVLLFYPTTWFHPLTIKYNPKCSYAIYIDVKFFPSQCSTENT